MFYSISLVGSLEPPKRAGARALTHGTGSPVLDCLKQIAQITGCDRFALVFTAVHIASTDHLNGHSQQITALLRRNRSALRSLFEKAAVPPPVAEDILAGVVALILRRWDSLTDPDRFLLDRVNRACKAYRRGLSVCNRRI